MAAREKQDSFFTTAYNGNKAVRKIHKLRTTAPGRSLSAEKGDQARERAARRGMGRYIEVRERAARHIILHEILRKKRTTASGRFDADTPFGVGHTIRRGTHHSTWGIPLDVEDTKNKVRGERRRAAG